ncbi:GNAT family N-acetyltransferase [Prosthecochloris sp. GSB1]|uniref:GNAT family N-acetyltransferase n=1 Tax=Prosthecochloris sp. GSB1 TaxID=281093 RepID=UPI000B8CFF8F|nr:GNAT family N-acetyltransferase [Prosthecochloris sp. GSB1]ASQ90166.1 GNAT family N-acetyltransferase [Prosthecochloris sp. GSB1]
MQIEIKETRIIPQDQLLEIYTLNGWSSAEKPGLLHKALLHSHTLVSAWVGGRMVGLANAISDGYLVVYYPHMLVHPEFQGKGIGSKMMRAMQEKYKGFHQQMLTADSKAVGFYRKCGFEKAGKTEAMWIYQGNDH